MKQTLGQMKQPPGQINKGPAERHTSKIGAVYQRLLSFIGLPVSTRSGLIEPQL
jgi:hypothetical protein